MDKVGTDVLYTLAIGPKLVRTRCIAGMSATMGTENGTESTILEPTGEEFTVGFISCIAT